MHLPAQKAWVASYREWFGAYPDVRHIVIRVTTQGARYRNGAPAEWPAGAVDSSNEEVPPYIISPPLVSQSDFDILIQPFPLHSFLPAQEWEPSAALQAP